MTRTSLIAGNWKMFPGIAASAALAREIVQGLGTLENGREVMLAPPAPALDAVARALRGSPVRLGAQNVCWEAAGAYTGETSPEVLRECGAAFAIVGHSERRHIFGEDDALVNRRLGGALAFGLTAVLCVGETLKEREDGRTLAVLEEQVRGGLAGVDAPGMDRVVVAYEPVWAIGTGKTASVDQAQEAHAFIRSLLAEIYEKSLADQVRILYGGSVKPDNVDALMAAPDIDGALVGGASLQAESFLRIIHYTA